MHSSQTTDDICQEDNQHKPVKQVRSNDSSDQSQRQRKQHRSPFGKNRSLSSGFRHSIRNLTSCAAVRRKPCRSTDHNEYSLSTSEAAMTFDDEQNPPSNSLLIPTRSSSSSPHKNLTHQIESKLQSTVDDIPPVIPPRKPVNKKDNIQILSTTSNRPISNYPLPLQSTKSDDISLPDSRHLSNKEISTSLVNLMGTVTDSVSTNNTTQIPTHESRHISSTPASTVDRLGLYGSSTNIGTTSTVESSQRTGSLGNNLSTTSSSILYTKSPNEHTWCYESLAGNNEINLNECLPRLEIDDKPLIYRQQFEQTEHLNWYGISDSHGPVIISYKYSNDQDKQQRYLMAIVRTRQRTSIESLLDISSCLSSIDILRRICEQCAIIDIEYFDPVLCDGAHDLLIKYDESYVCTKHKFGIIYQRENQLTEEEIFSNEGHSIGMNKFLDLIGNRVKLKDFQGFRGGLDIKSDQTGIESIYEQFNNHEIMFHVSTLLPYSKIERQQLERKRHIGNDIVAIIFQENETIFNPECITSQFLHVYIVITPLDNHGTCFKVSVIHRDTVPTFGPLIYDSNIFHYDNIFKQWLLTKLINAEIASCRSSSFQKYQERTKMNLFENLYHALHEQNRPFMNFILNHSQYKHECDIEQHKDDIQINSSTKIYDRHNDNSLLGSVRRRFIVPKLRNIQHPTAPTPTPIIISTSTNNTQEVKSKARSMTIDLKRSSSKESMTPNGKMISMFSLSKNHSPRIDKSTINRSSLEVENIDSSSLSPRSNSKLSTPLTCPSTPLNTLNSNDYSYLVSTEFDFSKLSTDDTDHDNHNQLSPDSLKSSSKDDLIKFIISLQQQHTLKLTQLDQIHSKTIKQLEMQLSQQQQNSIDRDN